MSWTVIPNDIRGGVATTGIDSPSQVSASGSFQDLLNQYNTRLGAYNAAGLNGPTGAGINTSDSDVSTIVHQSEMNPGAMSDGSSFSPWSFNGQNAYRRMQDVGNNQSLQTIYDPSGNVLNQQTLERQTSDGLGGFLRYFVHSPAGIAIMGMVGAGALGAGGAAAGGADVGAMGSAGAALGTGGTAADVAAGTQLGASLAPGASAGLAGAEAAVPAGSGAFSLGSLIGGQGSGLFGGNSGIGTLGSILNSYLGYRAAGNAANTQTNAANQANQTLLQSQQNAINQVAPWRQAGSDALGQYASILGLGGQPANFDVTKMPGYQFTLDQGINAIENSGSARGMSLSGNTLRSLDQFGQGNAQQYYQNYLDRLSGLSTVGANAATGNASNIMNTGSAIGNNQLGIGNVQAAGQVGQMNAITSGINNALNNYYQQQYLSSIFGG